MPVVLDHVDHWHSDQGQVAGSDMFDALRAGRPAHPIRVSVGGAEGVAAEACRALNAENGGMHCVGSLYPRFCWVDEMSRQDINRHH